MCTDCALVMKDSLFDEEVNAKASIVVCKTDSKREDDKDCLGVTYIRDKCADNNIAGDVMRRAIAK